MSLLIKREIDKIIYRLSLAGPKNVYGGQTENTLQLRLSQHKRSPRFKDMKKMTLVYNFTDPDEVGLWEQYLIGELKSKFGKKCLNIDETNNRGQQNHLGDVHKLFIMWK